MNVVSLPARPSRPPTPAPAGGGAPDVYLHPGQWWFGGGDGIVRTLLGSCVSVTLWHPRWRLGGMCHYLLPQRLRARGAALDGRYGDEALDLLRAAALRAGCRPGEFEAKLFGGGRMFARPLHGSQVHERNVELARRAVRGHGFRVVAEHLGGHGHRQVTLVLRSGEVLLRHTPLPGGGDVQAA